MMYYKAEAEKPTKAAAAVGQVFTKQFFNESEFSTSAATDKTGGLRA